MAIVEEGDMKEGVGLGEGRRRFIRAGCRNCFLTILWGAGSFFGGRWRGDGGSRGGGDGGLGFGGIFLCSSAGATLLVCS